MDSERDAQLKLCVTCDVYNQNDKLKEFARNIIMDECWDLGGTQNRDGATVQDLAERLGLIELDSATQEDADASDGLFEKGDAFYRFSDMMKE